MPDEEERKKLCFVISPIGDPGSDARRIADELLENAIRPVMGDKGLGYNVIRADQISQPGMITVDVLTYVMEADVVIAVLTEHNPNVFYELAIRHAAGKPYIQIIDERQKIPFDLVPIRTIKYDPTQWSGCVACTKQLAEFMKAIENNPLVGDNPVFEALRLREAFRSGDAQAIDNAMILQEVIRMRETINADMSDLQREVKASSPVTFSGFGNAVGRLTTTQYTPSLADKYASPTISAGPGLPGIGSLSSLSTSYTDGLAPPAGLPGSTAPAAKRKRDE